MLFESSYDSTCPVSVWSGNLRTCGYVIVDVNGIKSPNQVGKDVYLLFFTDVNTVPAGNIAVHIHLAVVPVMAGIFSK